MSTDVSFDTSEVDRFAADLGRVPGSVVPAVCKIIEVGAVKIKKDMASDIAKSPHFRKVAPAISYDMRGLSAEIGPEVGKAAGSLAFLAAHGSSTMGPSWDYAAPLEAEGKVVEGLLLAAVGKAVL